MNAPRPAHWKAVIGDTLVYACYIHQDALKADLDAAHALQDVEAHERDKASVWCHYCERETK